ncbi:MAG: DUF5680 domain-containing protein [Patescibacteria group bacterium]
MIIDKEKLKNFLLIARTKTYAGAGGKTEPALNGSEQLEHKEGDWLYRDVYYTGNGIFMGFEVIHFQDKPVWSMCYYGNFKKMTEEEIDRVLRKALMENWQTTRLWNKVEWEFENYKYVCVPDFPGSINEIAGFERIFKDEKEIYSFYYAGGFIGRD